MKIPQIDSLENIVEVFQHKDIAAAYGRQLPHEGASVYAAVDREFNYPPESRIKSLADIEVLGIKTAFLYDSFAAYRISALKSVGGFPRIDICEDMYIAGKLLLDGYKTAYVAEATVMHSHEPVLKDIWCRYRAMGRFQKDNSWIADTFGKSTGEGVKLFKYQLARITNEEGIIGIAEMFFWDILKFLAFKLA